MAVLGTPGSAPTQTLDAGAFAKCAPSLRTNIKQCGTVTQMNAAPMTVADLEIYQKSNDWRVMGSLLYHDMEIKMCEAVQNGLYDFFMSQKVNLSRSIRKNQLTSDMLEIAPFIKARQYSPINNEYWGVTAGTHVTESPDHTEATWSVRVASTTNIPADAAYFPVPIEVHIQGQTTGGSATRTSWEVVQAVQGSGYVTLYLKDMNAGSNLLPYMGDKLGAPTTGILTRGLPNINRYEKFCAEPPTLLNNKLVPFWTQGTRNAMCNSSNFAKWRELVLANNPMFKEFWDLSDIEKNKQIGADFQRRFVNQMFWGKPRQHQNMNEYDELEEITSFDASTYGMGVDNGSVIGRRANAVGIYEQLAECDRIVDLQGGQLNLPALFKALYRMMRVKKGNGSSKPAVFDLCTNSVMAELINQAMMAYFKAKSLDMLRFTTEAMGPPKVAEFGFNYRSYVLFNPVVTINVITHDAFDDWRDAGRSALGADDVTTNVIWILDFPGIYPGIISSTRKVFDSGDHKTMAAVNEEFGCVEEVHTKQQTLTGMVFTTIVECPASNLILENIDEVVPEDSTERGQYPTSETSTTSSTAFANQD